MVVWVLVIVFILAVAESLRRGSEGEDTAIPLWIASLTMVAGIWTEFEVYGHTVELAQTRNELRVAQDDSGKVHQDLQRLDYNAREQERQHELALNQLGAIAQSQIAAARDEVSQLRAQLGIARQTISDLAGAQSQLTTEARNAIQAANVRVADLDRQLGVAEQRLTDLSSQNAQLAADVRSNATALNQMNETVARLEPRHFGSQAKSALLAFVQLHPGRYVIHSVPGLDDAAGLVQEISEQVMAGGAMRPDWDAQYAPEQRMSHVLVAAPNPGAARDLATIIMPLDNDTRYSDGPSADGYAIYLGARS